MKSRGIGLWLVVCSWAACGQPLTREQLTGTWIGVHTELGPGAYCPLPAYLDLQPNGTYQLGLLDGSTPAQTVSWAMADDTVRLGTISYAPGLVTCRHDTLRIGTVFPLTFRRFRDVVADSAAIQQVLINRSWQTDSLVIHLHSDGRICLESCATGQRTVHHWRLTRFAQSVFMLVQGSQHTTDGHYRALWQVGQVTDKTVQLRGWNGQRVAVEPLRLVGPLSPGDSCRATGFQVCDNCFAQRSAFVGSGISSSQQYAVQKIVRQQYQPLDLPEQSGLIQVRFVINCAGETGRFTLIELDEDYCDRVFDRRITSQFADLCRYQLPALLLGSGPDADDRSDKAVTLNFRLKAGRLTDVFP